MAGSWRSDTLAVGLGALLLTVGACGRPEPSRVRRYGTAGSYVTSRAVTKAVVAPASTVPVEIAIGGGAAGRLHVTASVVTEHAPAAARLRCAMRVVDGQSVAATMELDAERREWVSAVLDVGKTGPAARLVMACDGAAAGEGPPIAWAQPVLVPTADGEAPPLIVLLSLDTLRADHVYGFGAPRGATPALDRLAREGVRMTETMAEGTWTMPSHFALLYGRLYGFRAARPPLRGLAQLLADHGWATAAFTGGGYVGAFFRFHLGFDHFAEYDAVRDGGSDVASLPQVLADAERWIAEFAAAPSAVFIHTYAVHELTPVEMRWLREHPLEQFVPTRTQMGAAGRFYLDLVSRTDAILAPFFDRLRTIADTRPVLLVVFSDHGEAFGEHRNFRHGDEGDLVTLHDEVTRVPLIVWGSEVAQGVVSRRPAMLGDVAPSILAAAGIPRPSSMRGESLWPIWTGRESPSPSNGPPSVSRGIRGWALRTRSWKLIAEETNGSPHVELYALARDPSERRDLADRYPRVVAALRRRLNRRVAGLTGIAQPGPLPTCPLCLHSQMREFWDGALMPAAEGDEAAIDAATRARLRALGYLDH